MLVIPGDITLAGDILDSKEFTEGEAKLILGPGLIRNRDEVVCTKCGILKKSGKNTYWVENHQKRYVPAKGECVLGVVTNARGDMFKVDISASEEASISYLAFEGATKRNRPIIHKGDIIFAKLLVANKDVEPELVCVNAQGKKGRLGIMPEGGFLFTCSLNLVRKLLDPSCPLLTVLGKEFPYEVVIGINGKIWVKTKSARETIAVCNALLSAEFMTQEDINKLAKSLCKELSSMC